MFGKRKEPQQHTDPVCGMKVDEKMAAAKSSYEGATYYFCSETCKNQFQAAPERFTEAGVGRS